MTREIFGRNAEKAFFKQILDSGKAELIAVYGRRRIGKTFLVREYFADKFDFYCTGSLLDNKKTQLARFCQQLSSHSGQYTPQVESWDAAFSLLKNHLATIKDRPAIVFIDEFPWLDTPRSKFLSAFEIFWNSWGCMQDNLKFIACGSATTWMTNKLLGNKGGLHNRVTQRIHLGPFSLYETEQFFKSRKFAFTRQQILDAYMCLGGTPFYLEKLDNHLSVPQNIDTLFFSKNAKLADEYNFLFQSLFNDSIAYKRVIELLASKACGITRAEIVESLKITDNGVLTEILKNLESCDFIRSYTAFGKHAKETMFQMVDLFSLFYLHYVKGYRGRDEHRWSNMIDSGSKNAWSGYAFEQVCLQHINQIKQKLGISGISSDVCSWRHKGDKSKGEKGKKEKGAQIDLLIDRRDGVINLCEMKYANAPFLISSNYMETVKARRELFRQVTKTRKALYLTFATTCGLAPNEQRNDVQSEITLDDLFVE